MVLLYHVSFDLSTPFFFFFFRVCFSLWYKYITNQEESQVESFGKIILSFQISS